MSVFTEEIRAVLHHTTTLAVITIGQSGAVCSVKRSVYTIVKVGIGDAISGLGVFL